MEWADDAGTEALIGRPAGRIDEEGWEAFLTAASDAIARAGKAGLPFVIDLSQVDYMSSRGLRALSLARREADRDGVAMVLAAPNSRTRDILAISRYDKIFEVASTVEAAVAALVKG